MYLSNFQSFLVICSFFVSTHQNSNYSTYFLLCALNKIEPCFASFSSFPSLSRHSEETRQLHTRAFLYEKFAVPGPRAVSLYKTSDLRSAGASTWQRLIIKNPQHALITAQRPSQSLAIGGYMLDAKEVYTMSADVWS